MLTITRQQYEALSKAREQGFIARAVTHLRKHHSGWCGERNDDALAAHISTMVAWAREHSVTRQDNVLRLIDLQLRTGFILPLCGYLYYCLTQCGVDEATRVHNFARALSLSRKPVVVALDTDLDALERHDA